jgi:hypothetical protein
MPANFVKWGYCELCGFRAVLTLKDKTMPGELEKMTFDASVTAHIKNMKCCLTCAATPDGVKSDNQTHKRLPESEYLLVDVPDNPPDAQVQ